MNSCPSFDKIYRFAPGNSNSDMPTLCSNLAVIRLTAATVTPSDSAARVIDLCSTNEKTTSI